MIAVYTWDTIYKKSGKYYYILYGSEQPIDNMTLSALSPEQYVRLVKDGYKEVYINGKLYLIRKIVEK